MKCYRGPAWSAAIALTLAPGLALAQYGEQAEQQERPAAATERDAEQQKEALAEPMAAGEQRQAQLVHAEQYAEASIVDRQGQELGQVEELRVDVEHGRIAYVIATLNQEALNGAAGQEQQQDEGWLGGGDEERYALPWQAFEADQEADQDQLRLSIDTQQLRQAESFQEGEEPDFNDRQWAQQTHQQLGLDPYWEQDQGMEQGQNRLQRPEGLQDRPEREQREQAGQQDAQAMQRDPAGGAQAGGELNVHAYGDLSDFDVVDSQEEELGQINDLVIDTGEGRVIYGIVSYGGVMGIGDDLAPVPFQALQFDAEQERFSLDATEQELDQVAYQEGEEPDWQDEQWAMQTHQTFGQEPYWQVFGYAPPGQGQEQGQQDQPERIEHEHDIEHEVEHEAGSETR